MMRMMIFGMVLAAGPAAAQESAAAAEELLASWQPQSVTMDEDGSLRIVLPQRRVTAEIYSPVVRFGLCLGPIATGDMMEDVTSIKVLNQFEAQGFVYEKGLDDCATLTAGDTAAAELALMSATHGFMPDR